MRHLLTNAMAALPNDEEGEITTPSGHKVRKGLAPMVHMVQMWLWSD